MVVVVKVGGSLAKDKTSLSGLCQELTRLSRRYSMVIVPGGGPFADVVRDAYRAFNLSETIAHRMAIMAMDQYGLLLHSLTNSSFATYDLQQAVLEAEKGRLPILLPSRVMLSTQALKASWEVTSDSISAFIATLIRAKGLILAKDVNGVFTKDPKEGGGEIYHELSARALLKKGVGCVDGFLPRILMKGRLDCFVVNGKHPERVEDILKGNKGLWTKIIP